MNYLHVKPTTKQHGTALITSLVLLMALTMVSLAAMQSTTVQLQISGNDETTVDAFERAQSAVDALIDDGSYFVVGASTGYTVCTSGGTGCNANTIVMPGSMFASYAEARVEYLQSSETAPRMSNGSSGLRFGSATFSITGSYDATSGSGGRAEVVQGYTILIPKQ